MGSILHKIDHRSELKQTLEQVFPLGTSSEELEKQLERDGIKLIEHKISFDFNGQSYTHYTFDTVQCFPNPIPSYVKLFFNIDDGRLTAVSADRVVTMP